MLMKYTSRAAFALIAFFLYPAAASAAPVVISGPVAPPLPPFKGTGLCVATAASTNATSDFAGLNVGNYNGELNAFMEGHANSRTESIVGTLLDLSNNNASGFQQSYGDFANAMAPTCKIGGCDFVFNDTTTPFASRLRGFFNVTPELAQIPHPSRALRRRRRERQLLRQLGERLPGDHSPARPRVTDVASHRDRHLHAARALSDRGPLRGNRGALGSGDVVLHRELR